MYVVCDGATDKTHSVIAWFFLFCLWWRKGKNGFYCNVIFSLFFGMEEEKKIILLWNDFFYVLYNERKEKAHSVILLFFLCCLWWSKRKNSFYCHLIFCMLSRMEQQKKLILLQPYFFHVVSDGAREKNHAIITLFFEVVYDGGREKTHSVIKLFFLYCRWWSKRKKSFCYPILCCMLSMMDKEKNFLLSKSYFLYPVYDGAREKLKFILL